MYLIHIVTTTHFYLKTVPSEQVLGAGNANGMHIPNHRGENGGASNCRCPALRSKRWSCLPNDLPHPPKVHSLPEFTLGVVCSVALGKCVMTYIHHCNIQNTFFALKILHYLTVHLPSFHNFWYIWILFSAQFLNFLKTFLRIMIYLEMCGLISKYLRKSQNLWCWFLT